MRGPCNSSSSSVASAERDAYLAVEPAEDVRFVAAFAHALEHTGGYTTEEARRCLPPSSALFPG